MTSDFETIGSSADRWVIFVKHDGHDDWINVGYSWTDLLEASKVLLNARIQNPQNRYSLFKETTTYTPEQV